jgi:hypothetical protein
MGDDVDGLSEDLEDDPLWRQAELMANAPPRPTKGYVTCSLTWLARVLPVLRTSDRLAVALLIYRQCLLRRSKTVDLSNNLLAELGIGRDTKYRALTLLQEAGAVTIKTRNGRSVRVTLHWFP